MIDQDQKEQPVSSGRTKAKVAPRRALLMQLFNDDDLSMSALCQLLRTLSDPCKLGARFCWGYEDEIHNDEYQQLGIDRRLWVYWFSEEAHPMTDADETRLVLRLQALGFTFVNERYIWQLLWPTLPHDGNGRSVRR